MASGSTNAASSAQARNVPGGASRASMRGRRSAATAKSSGESGHPCRIPPWTPTRRYRAPPSAMSQKFAAERADEVPEPPGLVEGLKDGHQEGVRGRREGGREVEVDGAPFVGGAGGVNRRLLDVDNAGRPQ